MQCRFYLADGNAFLSMTCGTCLFTFANTSAAAGGHLNPAITMGCLCTKKVTAQRAVCYWVAQVPQLL